MLVKRLEAKLQHQLKPMTTSEQLLRFLVRRLAAAMRDMVSVRAAGFFTTSVKQLVWKAADEQHVCWCQLKAAVHIEAP